jgi:two-component system phosphate regulon response regulator PhoB
MVSLLKTLLGMEGYQVETLLDKSGDMMENIRESKPDIFLVDVFLGNRNGLEVVRELRRQPDLKDIKVVMASGTDKADECLAAGANAFLLKPYMPDDLIKLLRAQQPGAYA